MAATIAVVSSVVPGASVEKLVAVTLDNSYPNPAGYVFTASSFGLTVLRKLLFSTFTTVAGGAYQEVVVPTYNSDGVTLASAALHLVVGTTGVEVANAVNVSGVTCSLVVGGN